jgi:hypothetical protein
MKDWIANYVKGCATCQQNKNLTHKTRAPQYKITVPTDATPFSQITLDLITGLPRAMATMQYSLSLTMDAHAQPSSSHAPCRSQAQASPSYTSTMSTDWFGLPTKVISDHDPRFTSHFGRALSKELGITRNLSTAFHPQTDGLTEHTNQWVEQYLRLLATNQRDWSKWLTMATIVHNNARNSTTGFAPSTLLVGWEPTLAPPQKQPSSNLAASRSVEQLRRYCTMATQALNSAAAHHHPTTNLWTMEQQVWLDAKNLKLAYGTAKLAPRCHGPFRITRVLSPVAYEIGLPAQWNIHPVFHASLLMTYRETSEHGPNYTRPPLELIGAEEEYEVEAIRSHRRHGRHQKLQYLIKWRGYPESDNTWEPAEQVHAPLLTKPYDRKHRTTNATTPTSIKTAIVSPQECPKTRSTASSSTTMASSTPSAFLLAHLSAIHRTPLTDSTNSPQRPLPSHTRPLPRALPLLPRCLLPLPSVVHPGGPTR